MYTSRPPNTYTKTIRVFLYTLVNMSLPNTTYLVHQEGRITLAIEALNQGRCTSIRAAVKLYNIVRSTLQDRINKYPVYRDSRPASCKLIETKESTLVQ
jgi:hypothetical protein